MEKRVIQPAWCPVCRMSNSRHNKMATLMRNLDDLSRIDFMCGYCGSFFWWKLETRQACGLESRYPLTRQGWDTCITHIDPKYENGDVCPRCNADSNFREDKFWGQDRKCVICDGAGIYSDKDLI